MFESGKKINKEKIRNNIKDFFSNNTTSAMLDNILAMFPSTILMPLLVNAAIGFDLFDISLVLFLTGLSTLFFLIYTRGRLPGYLGSSFAFIGVTSYIVTMLENQNIAKDEVSGYIIGAFLCAALFLLLLSLLCKLGDVLREKKQKENKNTDKTITLINKIIPTAVLGPSISLIGLELSDQAVSQAGFNTAFNTDSLLAVITVFAVILLSVTRRPIFKKSSILIGVLIAGIIAIVMNKWDLSPVWTASVVRSPSFNFIVPKFSFAVDFMVLPPTVILFCEHLARKMTTEGVIKGYLDSKPLVEIKKASLFRTISANAFAIAISGFMGGVPLTLYAENIAVMRINNDPRPNQFYLAAVVVMILSFSGNLLSLIQSVPSPIIGGLSFVLMGIIAAPGIKMLVDAKVDYTKITNLFLTASVLIVGLSDMSFNIFGTQIKGMSLGLLVGIIMNLIFKLLSLLNISREHMGFADLKNYCAKEFPNSTIKEQDNGSEILYSINKCEFLKISNDFDELRITVLVAEPDDECLIKYKSKKIDDKVSIVVNGMFKNQEITNFINKSYNIAKYGLNAPCDKEIAKSNDDLDENNTPENIQDDKNNAAESIVIKDDKEENAAEIKTKTK